MDELVKESVKGLRKKLSEVRKKACPKVSGMKKPEVVAEILYLEAEAKRREEGKEEKEKVVEEASKHKPERGRYTSKRKAMAEVEKTVEKKMDAKKTKKEAVVPVPAPVLGKPAKGSLEMKEKMAKLRAMRKKKEEK